MKDSEQKNDANDSFEPFPREVYEPEPIRNIGNAERPVSEPYVESSSGKSMREKCTDDLKEYNRKLSEWKGRRVKTIRMFGNGYRSEPILEKIDSKIEFYERLIEKTEEQRNGD